MNDGPKTLLRNETEASEEALLELEKDTSDEDELMSESDAGDDEMVEKDAGTAATFANVKGSAVGMPTTPAAATTASLMAGGEGG